MMKLRIAALAFIVVAAMPACKKGKSDLTPDNGEPTQTTPTTGSRIELSLDSLYLYAKETYLWYDVIPDYATFNPRGYAGSDELASLNSELFAITKLKINPATGQPYEYINGVNPKYSFVEKGNAAQGIKGSVNLEGEGNDFGLGLAIYNGTTVYVRLVEKGSPAATQNITRGCLVILMNGAPPVPNQTVLGNALSSNTISLRLQRPTGEIFNVTLNKATYNSDPVNTWTTFTNGTNITGYLNLVRFSRQSTAEASLNAAFAEFATKNVNNLVIDLRYNGGGYVATAEYLANLIGPSSKTAGKVMYIETFNKLLQEGKAPILKSIPYLDANGTQVVQNGKKLTYADVDFSVARNTNKFEKKGSLGDLKNVVFIVSSATASASELVINSLKPYVNVMLVGPSPYKTYGKPVGFFGIGISSYTVYMSQFTSVNALGQGEYYAGMDVTIKSADDVTKDFGDATENSLAKALAYINTGATNRVAEEVVVNGRAMSTDAVTTTNVGAEGFTGMVEERRKLKQ